MDKPFTELKPYAQGLIILCYTAALTACLGLAVAMFKTMVTTTNCQALEQIQVNPVDPHLKEI